MLTFAYEARNSATGQKIKAEVQAEDERQASKLIQSQGLVPINITAQKLNTGTKLFNRVKSKDRVLFARQLSTLINAGLPLVQSLRTVQTQTSNKRFKSIINEIIADVEAGHPFSQALDKHPEVFNKVFVSLVASGEVSGTLDASLERLAVQQEKDAEIIAKVRGAMVYPAMVVLVMVAVVTFMLVSVMPQVKIMYDGLPGSELPLVTKALLFVSGLLTRYWYLVVALIVLFIALGSRWINTIGGKRFIDSLKVHTKPINRLFMKVYMARFARTGATLVASGVPLIQMLEVTSAAVNNILVSDSINKAITQVKGGKALSDSLMGDPNFLELVPNMIHIGEQSGSLEDMMSKTADYYEKEVDNEIKTISTIIEPILMIVLGGVAFTIVAAVLLPIYSLSGQTIIR